jgi:hypothetical protein
MSFVNKLPPLKVQQENRCEGAFPHSLETVVFPKSGTRFGLNPDCMRKWKEESIMEGRHTSQTGIHTAN